VVPVLRKLNSLCSLTTCYFDIHLRIILPRPPKWFPPLMSSVCISHFPHVCYSEAYVASGLYIIISAYCPFHNQIKKHGAHRMTNERGAEYCYSITALISGQPGSPVSVAAQSEAYALITWVLRPWVRIPLKAWMILSILHHHHHHLPVTLSSVLFSVFTEKASLKESTKIASQAGNSVDLALHVLSVSSCLM
jgi:hypothetical protein